MTKLRLFPATTVVAFAMIVGAGGAYALQAAGPGGVEQQQTPVQFQPAATDADVPAPAATPAAEPPTPQVDPTRGRGRPFGTFEARRGGGARPGSVGAEG